MLQLTVIALFLPADSFLNWVRIFSRVIVPTLFCRIIESSVLFLTLICDLVLTALRFLLRRFVVNFHQIIIFSKDLEELDN